MGQLKPITGEHIVALLENQTISANKEEGDRRAERLNYIIGEYKALVKDLLDKE